MSKTRVTYNDGSIVILRLTRGNSPDFQGGQHTNGPAAIWCKRIDKSGVEGPWHHVDRSLVRTLHAADEIVELAETADEAMRELLGEQANT